MRRCRAGGQTRSRYCTYYSYYYLPGLGRRVPGIQSDLPGSQFPGRERGGAVRGLNMVVMKASRRGSRFNCGTNVDIMLQAHPRREERTTAW